MLRACNRVLTAGGVLGFLVIVAADGLSPADRLAALEAGPEYVAVDPGYRALVEMAGFVDVGIDDLTAEYATTAAAWMNEWDREAAELELLLGTDDFRERQARRDRAVGAIGAGLLKRYLITARAPG